jgi:hypothetical protein
VVGNWAGCIASSALAPSYRNPTEYKKRLSHSVGIDPSNKPPIRVPPVRYRCGVGQRHQRCAEVPEVTHRVSRVAPRVCDQPTTLSTSATASPRRRDEPSTGRQTYPSPVLFRDECHAILTDRSTGSPLAPGALRKCFLSGEDGRKSQGHIGKGVKT